MQPSALASLDIEGGERFVLSDAHQSTLVRASDLPWEHVVRALEDPLFFMRTVAGEVRLGYRDIPLLQLSWATQNGLLVGDQLQRLLWILKHFRGDVEYDLRKHVSTDLGELWRARRWREILNLIDRLPRATWTHQSMANDPGYAEQMAEALAMRQVRGDEDEKPSSPLVEHTPEVRVLSDLVDAVNALRMSFIMANKKEGSPDPVIPPYPRPRTLLDTMRDKAQRKARWAAHESLVDRVIGRRQQPAEAPE